MCKKRENLTVKEQDEIVRLYEAGWRSPRIAQRFNIWPQTVGKVRRRRGVVVRERGATDEQNRRMVADYMSGTTAQEAAAKFNFSKTICINALEQAGIPRRSRSEKRRQYSTDETFFNKIDTEEKAYVLGFLTADGFLIISHGQPSGIGVKLAIKDRGHLVKLKAILKSEHPIQESYETCSNGKVQKMAVIRIHSRKLAAQLCRLGFTSNKSQTAHPCTDIPAELLRHYYRGLVDGDGWICKRRLAYTHTWEIGLCGTHAIVEGFEKYIAGQGIETSGKLYPRKTIRQRVFCGNTLPKQIGTLLWDGATVFLDRKHDKYLRLMAAPVHLLRAPRTWMTREDMFNLMGGFETWEEITHRRGVTHSGLYFTKRKTAELQKMKSAQPKPVPLRQEKKKYTPPEITSKPQRRKHARPEIKPLPSEAKHPIIQA